MFAAPAGRCRCHDPWSAGWRAYRSQHRPLVTGGDHRKDAGFRRSHERQVVRRGYLVARISDRVVDDVNAVGDSGIYGPGQIRRVAGGTGGARPEPAGLVSCHPCPWRNSLDAAQERSERGCLGPVAGGGGRRVGTVSVHVSRREEFTRIDGTAGQRAIGKPAGADEFVIAVVFRPALAGLALPKPVFRGLVQQDLGHILVFPA